MRQATITRAVADQRALTLAFDRARNGAVVPLPLTATPQLRGYHVEYTVGETNRCPGCSATAWLVGRFSAECGRCGTALPIARMPA